MYQVIARAWRPQRFSEVIGQSHVTDTLQNAIRRDRIGHGYIFSGQRGVGKTTLARLLAKAINCKLGPAPEPCGECDSCREVAAGRSVDVLEIDAASNRGIDAVRELRENVRYAPARDRYKVFIIDEAHQITPEGFNALLKTLEEPPPHVVFILATTEAHQFPETILSRCQHFAFRAVSFADIYAHLEKVCAAENVAADPEALAALTAAGEGSLRDALSRLEQAITAFGSRLEGDAVRRLLGAAPSRLLEEVFEAALAQDRPRMLDIVERLVSEGYQLSHFCSQLVRAARNLLVARVSGPQPHLIDAAPEEIERLAALAGQFTEEQLMRLLTILLELHQELRVTMEPRFQMELGLLKLVDAERLVAIEDLLSRMDSPGSGVAASVKASPPAPLRSAAPNPSPASTRPASPASRPSPFEQDLARKRQAQAQQTPARIAEPNASATEISTESNATKTESGSAKTESVSTSESVSTKTKSNTVKAESDIAGTVPSHDAGAEARPHSADNLRSPQEASVDEVLRRLEEGSKPALAALLGDAVRWEFGDAEVRIRLADVAVARVLPEADRKFLDRLVSEVLARTVRVQFSDAGKEAGLEAGKEDRSVKRGRPSPPSAAPSASKSAAGPADSSVEDRVRRDPAVQEFESLFGKPVTDIRRRRG